MTVVIQMIAETDGSADTIRQQILADVLNDVVLDPGEVSVLVDIGPQITINDNGYARPWYDEGKGN